MALSIDPGPGSVAAGGDMPMDRGVASPLVSTKVRPPTLAAGMVARARVDRRLDAGLADGVRLTLVSAPPGYGKTAAVAAWASGSSLPLAWVSLDEGDDLERFVRHLAAALAPGRPGALRVPAALGANGNVAPDLVAALLLEAVELDDREIVLVLDDYHAVVSPPVHALLRILIERAPPFLHTVVVTREDPPLQLAKLRAHRALVEIRVDELRFTAPEAAELLAMAGTRLHDANLERLTVRTEGWAAGLQLAAAALGEGPDPGASVAALSGSRRFVFDYLADEVLAGLPLDLRDFLARTSVVDRFTAALCSELTGRPDAGDLLAVAERRNLFVVRLDGEGRWFRYHHLFADYLRSLVDPEERRRLERRAATWFEAAGLPDEAIALALRSGAHDQAARAVHAHARAAFESGEIGVLGRWLDALGPAIVDADPELASLRAWTLFYGGRLGEALRLADRPGASAPTPGHGRFLILRGLIGSTTDPAAESNAIAGLELVDQDPLFRALGLEAVGLTRLARGDTDTAIDALREAYAEARRSGTPLAVLPAVNPLAHGLETIGRRDEAETLCREVLAEFAGPAGRPLPIAWSARLVLGIARYEADDPVGARNELEAGLRDAEALGVRRPVFGWALPYLALARAATGSIEEALAGIRPTSADTTATGLTLPSLSGETEARLRLVGGDIAAAARWADAPRPEAPPDAPILALLARSAELTVARVRLAQGRMRDAADLLAGLHETFTKGRDVPELISVAILQARAAQALGHPALARSSLEEAIRLAAPGGYVRRFVDDGASLRPSLAGVRPVDPAFVDRLLDALSPGRVEGAPGLSGSSRPAGSSGPSGAVGLVEPLTPRELDVLRLMATGAGNARIAEELFVSLGTAKWHVAHILAKLGSSSRTAALVRAQALGLV
ncbi:MAG TPA: LuxR C-terminal-related transcriptional regulator [Candidatus Limnocylindrales bacterium]